MYAVIQSGGRQYRVAPGDLLDLELLKEAPAERGAQVKLDRVLMIGDGDQVTVGQPTVDGARVVVEVLGEVKGKKITVFKYKSKVRYRRKTGHRQKYLRVRVRDVVRGEAPALAAG